MGPFRGPGGRGSASGVCGTRFSLEQRSSRAGPSQGETEAQRGELRSHTASQGWSSGWGWACASAAFSPGGAGRAEAVVPSLEDSSRSALQGFPLEGGLGI